MTSPPHRSTKKPRDKACLVVQEQQLIQEYNQDDLENVGIPGGVISLAFIV
jgi:hypothetical protein